MLPTFSSLEVLPPFWKFFSCSVLHKQSHRHSYSDLKHIYLVRYILKVIFILAVVFYFCLFVCLFCELDFPTKTVSLRRNFWYVLWCSTVMKGENRQKARCTWSVWHRSRTKKRCFNLLSLGSLVKKVATCLIRGKAAFYKRQWNSQRCFCMW